MRWLTLGRRARPRSAEAGIYRAEIAAAPVADAEARPDVAVIRWQPQEIRADAWVATLLMAFERLAEHDRGAAEELATKLWSQKGITWPEYKLLMSLMKREKLSARACRK